MNNELYTQIQYRLIEQLSESERRYRELVENLREIVFKCDRDGSLTLLNKAWSDTLGYSVEDCLNQNLEQFIHAEDRSLWQAALAELVSDPLISGKELRFQHQNTQTVWLELSARLKQGEITGSLADITERKQQTQQLEAAFERLKQAQAQLVQAEKMSSLGQLVAGIAHEINNPVNFIHGNLSHAHNYVEDLIAVVNLYQPYLPSLPPETQDEIDDLDIEFILSDLPKLLSSMQLGTDRIREIVLSLRNFSRLDEAEIKPVHLHDGIDSTLMILQHRLKATPGKREIAIAKSYQALPKIQCYAGQLNQVFMNLISNAIDAVEERQTQLKGPAQYQPQIHINTIVIDNNTVEIRIGDNGTGIKEATRERIFDPFFTTKPIGQGTGLGLSISYQIIVEKHRGSIQCCSDISQGTEFIIQIPISQGLS